MEDLSLHILDIVENSIDAGADRIEIRILEDIKGDLFLIGIKDNGRGMDEETIKMVIDPFFTTKTTRRVGLGLPFLAQAAKECNGDLSITSDKGLGTTVTAHFQHSHIDRKPLGDISATIIVLIAAHPDIDLIFEFKRDNSYYCLNTEEIRRDLGGVPINTPKVLKLIKEDIVEGLKITGGIHE